MGVSPCLSTRREIFSLLEWKMTEYDGILIVACLPYVFLYGFKFLSSRKTYIKMCNSCSTLQWLRCFTLSYVHVNFGTSGTLWKT